MHGVEISKIEGYNMRKYARLLVLQTNVKGQDVSVLDAFGHVRMSCTMIEDKTANELGLGRSSMLHFHDLNHVQVDGVTDLVGRIYSSR